MRFILTRRNTRNGLVYRDDPTILAWDLVNEPRCETWKVRGAVGRRLQAPKSRRGLEGVPQLPGNRRAAGRAQMERGVEGGGLRSRMRSCYGLHSRIQADNQAAGCQPAKCAAEACHWVKPV